MSAEPARRIEEQLKAYAQKRREEARIPFELHPATRRLLQDEVARTYRQTQERTASEIPWWRVVWPRLAAAASICVLLIVAVVRFLPSDRSKGLQLARNDQAAATPATSPMEEQKPSPESAAPTLSRLETKDGAARSAPVELAAGFDESPGKKAQQPATEEARNPVQPSPAAIPAGGQVREEVQPQLLMRQRYGLAPSKRGAPSGRSVDAGSPARTTGKSEAGQVAVQSMFGATSNRVVTAQSTSLPALRNGDFGARGQYFAINEPSSARTSQRFAQVQKYRANFNSPPLLSVLQSFQIEQSGQRIRIVDADGSVYEGQVEPAAPPHGPESQDKAKKPTGLEKQIEPDRPDEYAFETTPVGYPAAQGTRFHVAGTNRTSNLAVVFDGTVATTSGPSVFGTAAAGLAPATNAAARGLMPSQTALAQEPIDLPRARVQGVAVIGSVTRIEIDAVPATR